MVARTHLSTTLIISLAAATAAAQNIGPSTAVVPYLLPSRTGVSTTSIFTVNDPVSTVGGYRMVGIPDGLGAFAGPTSGSLTLVMNHELGNTAGIVRGTGFAGSFVSRWEIQNDLTVTNGRDFTNAPADVHWSSQPARALSRFCSADLALPSAFRFGTLGTDARIFLKGEESGTEGTAWAHIATGPAMDQMWELPALGRFSWENCVACPYQQLKTIVIGQDDTTPGQVYVYVGTKLSTGTDIELAGLTNGVLYGVRVPGVPTESRATPIHSTFEMAALGSQIGVTGATLDANSIAANVTRFLRPEDGAWDPRPGRQDTYYFATTDTVTASGGRSRLYRLVFTDITQPELGGTVDALLEGTEGQEMFDNLCVDTLGRIVLQEDVGNNVRLGKMWLYDTASESFGEIGAANPTFFDPTSSSFVTQDEEASGVIDAASTLGAGWFIFVEQSHSSLGGELVENGQLLALNLPTNLTMPQGVDNAGGSPAGCDGSVLVSVRQVPSVGNANFALGCVHAPASAPGAVALAASALPSPIPVLGFNFWLDPTTVFLTVGLSSDVGGRASLPLPIPSSATPGFVLAAQFVFVGPSSPPPCPPTGAVASNAVIVTIQ
ncbi:MAG: phytase [Planctomycetota bacterium]